MFRNWGTGAYSLVSLLIIIAVPTPQLGWQPQLTWPQSAPGPWTRSAKSANAPISDRGNQSRVGSVTPTCDFTSLARCESVYRFRSPPGKLLAFRKLDTVRCGLHAGISDFPGIGDRVQEIGRERRFATGKLNRHLPPWLDPEGVIHDLHDLFPGQFVDIAHLVRI